jgi:hypothetical protein
MTKLIGKDPPLHQVLKVSRLTHVRISVKTWNCCQKLYKEQPNYYVHASVILREPNAGVLAPAKLKQERVLAFCLPKENPPL